MRVADLIKNLRIKLKMNRTQFTHALGLKSRVTTFNWETGTRHPDIENVYKLINLAKRAGVELDLEMLMPNRKTLGE